jgi:hypothetical protein
MGIKPTFSTDRIMQRIQDNMELIGQIVTLRLAYIGEKVVNHCREIPADIGFTDRTGALRSSIGYVVYANGHCVVTNFQGNNAEGMSLGKSLADRIAARYATGWALVVVAGMNYALAVESRGRDVLTSGEHLAEYEVNRMVDQLTRKFAKL